ncbi:ABC transporter ATP-binding protein [Shewanella sp. 3_MG-2023]|uniref:ABC transporter ATP-binding protein n=1 Tax=Shewanella sp. 3_MG-2023 TaxID=3062635 RepID=UPI0026E407FB|nr:ABC transporter ATP-binding protein [Shewanella sp. 3_MG-2023]MDO6775797.1 ABC transporter ATP-binding protein [Shewanella sp. 3_MG-2023]
MDTSSEVILEFNQVSKSFDDKTVLKQLSFSLSAGMVVGLLGQNGAGKSTLMRSALGILDVDAGSVTTLGEPALNLSTKAKEKIGYVPQQPFGYEGFSVKSALELHSSFYPDWDKQLETDWLTRFGLEAKQQVQRLSVGQRQSLALIMAMAYRPQLLVLDEPVASLDPIVRRQFMSDLFELALESGSAVLFSSHITSDIERVASHVALIKQGELVLFKEIDALREEVKLVQLNADAVLPGSIKVLNRNQHTALVDNIEQVEIAGAKNSLALNLDQLFMELHR